MWLFGKKKEQNVVGQELFRTDDRLNVIGGYRKPLFSIEERIKKARFIEYNNIEYSAPDKPDKGHIEYVDGNGDRIRADLDDDEEDVTIFGFDIVEKLEEDDVKFKHAHEAYKTSDGLIVVNLGAMWSIHKEDGTVVIPEAHCIYWIGDKIYTTTGGSYRIFDAVKMSGEVIQTNKGLIAVAEEGTELCPMCDKRKIFRNGYNSNSVCAHCQREYDKKKWERN